MLMLASVVVAFNMRHSIGMPILKVNSYTDILGPRALGGGILTYDLLVAVRGGELLRRVLVCGL